MGKLTGLIQLTVDHVYLFHIHFIIMTTNRKELNGERSKSIQIDLAGSQWVREGRGGENQTLDRGGSRAGRHSNPLCT